MSKKNEEQSNETRREAVTLAKIVIHVLNMKQRTFGNIVTVFGYMVCAFVSAVAGTQGHDHDEEMAKFIEYLKDIWKTDLEERKGDGRANIIKLN